MDMSKNTVQTGKETPNSPLTNIYLPPLLKEYEEYTRTLQDQVEFLKNEHLSLRAELKNLIAENQRLSEELKAFKQPDVFDTSSPRHRKDLDMVSNLQQRLLLSVQEKESAVEMWQLALKQVDTLEYEVKEYKNNKHVYEAQKELNEVKEQYSTAITLLEERLQSVSAEATRERMLHEETKRNVTNLREELRAAGKNLEHRDSELMAGLETTNAAIVKIQELERKITAQSEELRVVILSRDELEQALIKAHERIRHLSERDQHACIKVQEALLVVEDVVNEREAAISCEALTKEENMHLQAALADLIEEAGRRVKVEVEKVKDEHNKKTETLLRDLCKIKESHAEREKLLERGELERKQLIEELEALRIESERPLLSTGVEHKINTAYRALTESERRNCQSEIELDAFKLEIKKLKERHKKDHERMVQECRSAYEEIATLQSKLESALQAKNATETRCIQLEEFILTLETRLNRLQCDEQHKCSPGCDNFSKEQAALYDRLQAVQKRSVDTISELQHHLECQKNMADKWQRTVKKITRTFETRINDLRSKTSQLKSEKRELQEQLNISKKEISRLRREAAT